MAKKLVATAIGAVVAVLGVYCAIIGACLWLAAKMFEYSLYCCIGVDVPWYLDLGGAIVLNAANLPLAIVCAIAKACGVAIPFFHVLASHV